MSPGLSRYSVATRFGAPPGETAVQIVKRVPGIKVSGTANASAFMIEATPQAVSELVKKHGDRLIVEEEVTFYPLSGVAAR